MNKKLLYNNIFAGTIFLLLIQSCAATPGGDYSIPDPAGDVSFVDGQIMISPWVSDLYFANPGIGWQHRTVFSEEVEGFPETIAYSDRRKIAWRNLNPKEGVYDWDVLDAQLHNAAENGKQFSFRVYTMVGEGYDGHMVPDWVIQKGAVVLASGKPDYSNCVYQEEWGRFISKLVDRYDGNPDIAFIDISGYGDFNEWSWQDEQTEWDVNWQANYKPRSVAYDQIQSLDGQARRRLADIFIGGSNPTHQCRASSGDILQVPYSYQGFEKSQLVMPYAGIVQSVQYVFSRRNDIGFRYDCLGRDGMHVFEKIGGEISKIWTTAPVIFELCKPNDFDLDDAKWLMQESHASIVHNNEWHLTESDLEVMMLGAGYRYFLEQAGIKIEERRLNLQMNWQNLGSAPSYPMMGQEFKLHFYLLNHRGEPVLSLPVDADISSWMPASALPEGMKAYNISRDIQIPFGVPAGEYLAGVSIIDLRTGSPIQLAFGGRDLNGVHVLTPVKIDR